jgi:hypothetical protein
MAAQLAPADVMATVPLRDLRLRVCFHRLRLRGLKNAPLQGLLIAAGRNRKRLLAATGWARRHAPAGHLLALPTASPSRSAVFV